MTSQLKWEVGSLLLGRLSNAINNNTNNVASTVGIYIYREQNPNGLSASGSTALNQWVFPNQKLVHPSLRSHHQNRLNPEPMSVVQQHHGLSQKILQK